MPSTLRQRRKTTIIATPFARYSLVCWRPSECSSQRMNTNGVLSSHSMKSAPAARPSSCSAHLMAMTATSPSSVERRAGRQSFLKCPCSIHRTPCRMTAELNQAKPHWLSLHRAAPT